MKKNYNDAIDAETFFIPCDEYCSVLLLQLYCHGYWVAQYNNACIDVGNEVNWFLA